ncbi:MAG: DHHA1 domain-containing protein [Patescibacteria group bacterium]
MATELKDTVVIYHAQCTDGFGAAFAAWKKLGDQASYIPLKTQVELPTGLEGKTIYVVDYNLAKETQQALEAAGTQLTVIDHHLSAQADVTAFTQNIFNLDHSGAVLTWQYFHPDQKVPELFLYIEDHDLWKFQLPDTRAFGAALKQYPFDFAIWNELMQNLADPDFKAEFIATGKTISTFEDSLVEHLLTYKERVRFEGHEVWALNVSRVYRSILGHHLADLNKDTGEPEIGIVYYRNQGAVHISLRSNGDTNVATIAEKYGGGGHKNAASIRVDSFAELPFEFIE